MKSKQIKSKVGTSFIENVENFVTKHIEPHETHFCFYIRLTVRHFEEYTNSIHKGTKRGLKYNSAPVGPSTNIKQALATMCHSSKRTRTKKKKVASIDFPGSKVYIKLKCSKKTRTNRRYPLSILNQKIMLQKNQSIINEVAYNL